MDPQANAGRVLARRALRTRGSRAILVLVMAALQDNAAIVFGAIVKSSIATSTPVGHRESRWDPPMLHTSRCVAIVREVVS